VTTTTNPTFEDGATTKWLPPLAVQPECTADTEAFADLPALDGINGGFVADVLSDMTMHERCGFHLYRSIAGRTNNSMLKRKYEEFGAETERHIEILETLLAELGIPPTYVSPSARATEGTDAHLLESTFLYAGSVDLMTQELVMLDAVLLAETRDHANWSGLADLVDTFPEGAGRDAVRRAVEQVEPEEDEHLEWAKSTRKTLISRQAKSTTLAKMATGAENLMARIGSWLD
jgi:rubrerythrin